MARTKGSKNKPKDGADVLMGKVPKLRTAKAPKKVPAAGRKVAKSHNQDVALEARRENFLIHLKAWERVTTEYDKKLKDIKAALKADGHAVGEMKVAVDLKANDKRNSRVRSAVETRLRVAYYIGDPLGAQLDLFVQPDRTPAVDRAYDQGKQDSMENKPCKPSYDPSTPQYAQYMAGYGDHQETLTKGFKPLKKAKGDDAPAASYPADEDWGDTDPAGPLN